MVAVAIDPVEIDPRIKQEIEGPPPPGAKGAFQFPAPGPCPTPESAEAYATALAGVPAGWILRNSFGFFERNQTRISLPDWASKIFGPKPNAYFGRPLIELVYGALQLADTVLAGFSGSSCSVKKLIPLQIQRGVKSVINHWIGIDIELAASPTDQIANYLCPTVISAPGDIVTLWVHDEIDAQTANNWLQFGGWCWTTRQHALYSHGYLASVGDVIAAWHHGEVDEDDLKQRELRRAGVLTEADRDRLIEINRYRHNPGFLCQLYFRGVIADEQTLYGRMVESGITQEGERQEQLAGSYTLLGVGEIYRALHLCRPGRALGGVTYTTDDARDDLKALGYAPRDVDIMMVLARADIGMRMATGPYFEGQIDADQLRVIMKDDGYADDTLELLAPFWSFQRAQHFAGDAGAPQSKELVADLAAGSLNSDEFGGHMGDLGYSAPVVAAGAKEAHDRRIRNIRSAGIASVRAGLQGGEMGVPEAVDALARFGVGADVASVIVDEWMIDFSAKSKPVGLGQLCDWMGKGWMTWQEYTERLQRMGYRKRDVQRIVDACDLAERKRRDAVAARTDKERARQLAIEQKLLDKAAKAAAKAGLEPETAPADGGMLGAEEGGGSAPDSAAPQLPGD